MTQRPAVSQASTVRLPVEADIRERAYEIYEARGREAGHEVEDWTQAERELRSRQEAHP